MKLILFLTLITLSSNAMTIRQALGQLESGNNDHAIGKRNERSRYQIMPDVWREFARRGEKQTNPDDAWNVAYRILARRISEFNQRYHRQPNARELYAIWNAPSQVMRGKVNKAVLARAIRFENLVNNK